MPQGFMAWIQPVEGGQHPDQGLPGGRPGAGGRPPRPGHLPSHRPGGRPVDPGYGVEGGVDPGYGVEGGDGEHVEPPIWDLGPDQGLPPVAGHPLPPVDPPPGTVWPPLPPDVEVTGRALVLAAIEGVGYRYIVVDLSGAHPDQGLPDEGEEGEEHPDQGLPGAPPRPGNRPPGSGPRPPAQPDQGLPGGRPGARPPTAGQLPTRPGARPDQGLPPTAQPKAGPRR